MRSISLLIAGTVLASCTTAPPPPGPPQRTPSGQRAFNNLLTGKVAGQPLNCLPNYNTKDNMSVIDGHTIAFNPGPRTVYLVHLTTGCEMIDGGPYALVSRQFASALCRGDIQQVVDTMNRSNAGSCTVAEIVPYTKP
ncbi:MAG TPA: DUF6491 family protein [Sphingomicrobium sp.]